MTRLKVNVIVQKEEKWYVAKCLDNNVTSQGKSIEESLENLKEALELYFEDYIPDSEEKQTFLTTLEVPPKKRITPANCKSYSL